MGVTKEDCDHKGDEESSRKEKTCRRDYYLRCRSATQNLAQIRKGKKTPGKDFNKSAKRL